MKILVTILVFASLLVTSACSDQFTSASNEAPSPPGPSVSAAPTPTEPTAPLPPMRITEGEKR